MQNKNDDEIFSKKVQLFIDDFSKMLTPELMKWLKTTCESNIAQWMGEATKTIHVTFVVDSNFVIKAIRYHAAGKISILEKLVNNPVFSLVAPKKLESEVMDYIENKHKDSNKIKLLEGWDKVRKGIEIRDIEDYNAVLNAESVIGKRDFDDVPFVAVYFEFGARAILTDDKDFEHPLIKKFSIPELGDVVGTYHRGMFSFVVVQNVLPNILNFVIEIIMTIARTFSQFLKQIILLVTAVLSGAITKIAELFSKAPPWLQGVLLGTLGISILVIIISKNIREKATSIIKNIWEKIEPIVTEIISWLKKITSELLNYVEKSGPYVVMAAETLKELMENIDAWKKELELISVEEITSYS